jgi:hypothetical protein
MRIARFHDGSYGEILGLVDTDKGIKARIKRADDSRELVPVTSFRVLQEEDLKPRRVRRKFHKY